MASDAGAPPVFPWLPSQGRPVGLALAAAGAALGYAVLARGFRPKFLEVRVFALHARYFESKAFTFIEKNVALELATVLVLVGLFATAFSRDRDESPEAERARLRAFAWALCVATALMILATLTLFGVGFAYALAAHVVVTLTLASAFAALGRARRALRRSP
ncbi:MAG: hypothetical protein JNM74_14320 [Myxococcales bacterium]|nr:hypothetical protein [Myxococcales bacterium]